jgi:hypothetical protein
MPFVWTGIELQRPFFFLDRCAVRRTSSLGRRWEAAVMNGSVYTPCPGETHGKASCTNPLFRRQ